LHTNTKCIAKVFCSSIGRIRTTPFVHCSTNLFFNQRDSNHTVGTLQYQFVLQSEGFEPHRWYTAVPICSSIRGIRTTPLVHCSTDLFFDQRDSNHTVGTLQHRFVLRSEGFEPHRWYTAVPICSSIRGIRTTPLVHCSTNLLSIMTKKVSPLGQITEFIMKLS
jgi:hypothetical protein